MHEIQYLGNVGPLQKWDFLTCKVHVLLNINFQKAVLIILNISDRLVIIYLFVYYYIYQFIYCFNW